MYTVPVQSALTVLDAARARIRPRELTDAVGIDDRLLREPTGRIAIRQLVALYELAARRTGESTIGLRVGASADLKAFDLLGYLIANSATVHDALANAARYLPLWTDGAVLQMIVDGATVHVIWEYLDPAIVECRQDCEMSVNTVIRIARGVSPREVHFRHSAPRDLGEHRRRLRAPVRFNMRTNQIIFETTALRTRVPGADIRLGALLEAVAHERLGERPASGSIVDRARVSIRRSSRLFDVARDLGLSPRSMERRLRAHGQSFRALRALVRKEMAEQYLRDSGLGLGDIARRLGYATVAEFHRAFRAWTGMTPGQFRRSTS